MATLQIRLDDHLKQSADELFASLGMDTTTAVRVFLNAALEHNGIPFAITHRKISPSLYRAIEDTRQMKNLHGPFATAEEAVLSMLED